MALLASVGRGPEPAVLRQGGFPSLVLPASCLVCVSWGLCMGECARVCMCVCIHQRAPASVELCVLGTLVVHLCASSYVHLCVCVCTYPPTKCSGTLLDAPHVPLCSYVHVCIECARTFLFTRCRALLCACIFSVLGEGWGEGEGMAWTPAVHAPGGPQGRLCASVRASVWASAGVGLCACWLQSLNICVSTQHLPLSIAVGGVGQTR